MAKQLLTDLILGHSFVIRVTDYIQLHLTLSNLGISKDTHVIHFIDESGCHAGSIRKYFFTGT